MNTLLEILPYIGFLAILIGLGIVYTIGILIYVWYQNEKEMNLPIDIKSTHDTNE